MVLAAKSGYPPAIACRRASPTSNLPRPTPSARICATLVSDRMRAPIQSIALAALACALLAGCRKAPEETPSVEPGRAVIYPAGAQAKQDIAAALAQAGKEKKRVLLDFGGNWCGDCQVLEIYFDAPQNKGLLDNNFVLVPVNIGRYDENL